MFEDKLLNEEFVGIVTAVAPRYRYMEQSVIMGCGFNPLFVILLARACDYDIDVPRDLDKLAKAH